MKKYRILIIEEAEKDIIEVCKSMLFLYDENYVLDFIKKIKNEIMLLEESSDKSRIVPELKRIKINTFFEVIFKNLRIIYEKTEDKIFIHAVLDSNQELEDLLYNRLVMVN